MTPGASGSALEDEIHDEREQVRRKKPKST